MPVNDTETVSNYAGNGSTSTPYPITIERDRDEDLKLLLDGVVSTAFAVAVDGFRTTVAQPGTVALTLYRETPLTQEQPFPSNTTPAAEDVRAGLDKLTLITQENAEGIERAVTAPIGGALVVSSTLGIDPAGETIARTVDEEVTHLGIGQAVIDAEAAASNAETFAGFSANSAIDAAASAAEAASYAGSVQEMRVAFAGYQWQANEVAVSIIAGQSNAGGSTATSAVAAPLANVKVIGSNDKVFQDYSATDNNAYSQARSDAAGPLQERARLWQVKADADSSVPDLYLGGWAFGDQGFKDDTGATDGQRWAPELVSPNGTPYTNLQSMWIHFQDYLKPALDSIRAAGKIPVLVDFLWVHGEKDSLSDIGADSYQDNLFEFYEMVCSVLGTDQPPFYTVELVDKNYTATRKKKINDAFVALKSAYPNVVNVLWDEYPTFDSGLADQGIFQAGDLFHYDEPAQNWLAGRVLDRLEVKELGRFDPTATAEVDSFMRAIPMSDFTAVAIGGATGALEDSFNQTQYLLKTDGELSLGAGHFITLKQAFATGGGSGGSDTSIFPFKMEVGLSVLPPVDGVLRVALAAPTATIMLDDGTQAGIIVEFTGQVSSKTNIRVGVAKNGAMVWSAVQEIPSLGYTFRQWLLSITVENGLVNVSVKGMYVNGPSYFFTDIANGPIGSGDATLLAKGNIQISGHRANAGAVIYVGGFFFTRYS